MDLNKENMKKMRELIVFTIILLIALWNYKLLFEWIGFAFGIVTPFLIGGGIAFVLNVPMSFFEETLFGNKRVKEKKLAKRLARPLSLVLTIVAVIGVVVPAPFLKKAITLSKSLSKSTSRLFSHARISLLSVNNSSRKCCASGTNACIVFPSESTVCASSGITTNITRTTTDEICEKYVNSVVKVIEDQGLTE